LILDDRAVDDIPNEINSRLCKGIEKMVEKRKRLDKEGRLMK
jgi:hypothetical protein